MKRESRTVDQSHQGDSQTQRHLPLVDLLVDTRAALLELAVSSGLQVLTTMLEEDRRRSAVRGTSIRSRARRNDSGLFRTRSELEEKEGAWPIGGNRFQSPSGEWVPLYVGRMIHQFDHRAASVHMNEENLHNPALSDDVGAERKADPAFVPTPQYWVPRKKISFPGNLSWTIAFRDIARVTDARTMIAAAIPAAGLGNTLPAIFPEGGDSESANTFLLLANLGAAVLDFVARQKVQSTHLNWYIVEQLPVVPLERYQAVSFGPKTAEEIIREAVLELTYAAHDMAPFRA